MTSADVPVVAPVEVRTPPQSLASIISDYASGLSARAADLRQKATVLGVNGNSAAVADANDDADLISAIANDLTSILNR